ncbi:MAG: nucleotidyltransferase family protein [Reyranellaceae bacterium]
MTQAHSPPPGAVWLWRRLLGQEATGEPPAWPGRDGWIAALSPALMADLAADIALDAEAVQKARLYGRFQQALQLRALQWIAAAGVSCVAIKGFASAFLYYPTPASRLLGDLDLLVRPAEAAALAQALQAQGFRFGGAIQKAWGFLSDASFVPLHSADGNCNVDIHVKPDSWPLPLGLDTEAVFARARQVMAGDRLVSVPCAEHMALILVSNLAKDKFAPDGLRKLLDLARLLASEHDFSWSDLIAVAERARMAKALETACGLLRAFGTPEALLHPALGRRNSAALRRLVRDWSEQTQPGLLRHLEREWLLAAEPGVAARLLARRGLGLIRARSGIPDAGGK